jgi:hypothetical protein
MVVGPAASVGDIADECRAIDDLTGKPQARRSEELGVLKRFYGWTSGRRLHVFFKLPAVRTLVPRRPISIVGLDYMTIIR